MEFSIETNAESGKISIRGRFDLNVNRHFRQAYDTLLASNFVREIEIEMSRVHYIDSSALGMLILLRERALAANKPVILSGATGGIGQVLEVANFGKIFNIR